MYEDFEWGADDVLRGLQADSREEGSDALRARAANTPKLASLSSSWCSSSIRLLSCCCCDGLTEPVAPVGQQNKRQSPHEMKSTTATSRAFQMFRSALCCVMLLCSVLERAGDIIHLNTSSSHGPVRLRSKGVITIQLTSSASRNVIMFNC